MKVGKRGANLAVRLPSAMVKALGVTAGDDVEIVVTGPRSIRIETNLPGVNRQSAAKA